MVAPFIRPIATQSGSFYTFSSAADDLAFTFNNDTRKFKFSKYALINIPPILRPTTTENFIQLDAVPGAFEIIDGVDNNVDFAESFQNYCLNLEAIVRSDANFNYDTDLNVSERVFFKWLKEIGAMRYRLATSTEATDNVHFVEEDSSTVYSRVIQYISDVDVVNSLKNPNNAFSEVYVYVPSSHGNTPKVLFQNVTDANYYANYSWTNLPPNPINAEVLVGRNYNDVSPADLSIQAFYDSADISPIYQRYLNGILNATWYTPADNTYYTDLVFNDPTNDTVTLTDPNTLKTVTALRSRLDGVSIEFDTTKYRDFSNDASLLSFRDYDASSASSSFVFNAVMIYYDIIEPDGTSTTNLYGILFLDDVEPLSQGGGTIPTLNKYKPNPSTGDGGTGYSFKINLKFDTDTDPSYPEVTVNEYNNISMAMFIDALDSIKAASDTLSSNAALYATIQANVDNLTDIVINQTSVYDFDTRLTAIEATINTSTAIFSSNQAMLDLLNNVQQNINNIYLNTTSVSMAYNLSVIQQGDGIFVDKSIPNQITITNLNQDYNLSAQSNISISTNFAINPTALAYTYSLQKFSNYLRINNNGASFTPDRNIQIYIDDSQINWQTGQVMRFSIKDPILMKNALGNFNLYVYTDALDTLNLGNPYSKIIGIIGFNQFVLSNNTPIFELICNDATAKNFYLDVIA
jgi:hypothetical protein